MSTPVFTFNPDEARDDHGRWTDGGGGDSPATESTHTLAETYRDGVGGRAGMGDIKISAEQIAALRQDGSTAARYLDEKGNWDPERQALHDQIVQRITAGVPATEQPTLFMTGGGPAAGKTEALAAGGFNLPDHYVHIDPDEIKAMLPEVEQMQTAGVKSWASASHEESSYLAKRVTAAAEQNSQNVVLDTTGDSTAERLGGKIDAARAAGFRVEGHYVTRDVEAAVERAQIRATRTGRAVPVEVQRGIYAQLQRTVPEVAPRFDVFKMYDNNGTRGEGRVIATGGSGRLDISDPAAWQRFLQGHA